MHRSNTYVYIIHIYILYFNAYINIYIYICHIYIYIYYKHISYIYIFVSCMYYLNLDQTHYITCLNSLRVCTCKARDIESS